MQKINFSPTAASFCAQAALQLPAWPSGAPKCTVLPGWSFSSPSLSQEFSMEEEELL